jgi:hypothetical protein
MGQMMGVVPNHGKNLGADNAWWLDVLENGQSPLSPLLRSTGIPPPVTAKSRAGAGTGRHYSAVLLALSTFAAGAGAIQRALLPALLPKTRKPILLLHKTPRFPPPPPTILFSLNAGRRLRRLPHRDRVSAEHHRPQQRATAVQAATGGLVRGI